MYYYLQYKTNDGVHGECIGVLKYEWRTNSDKGRKREKNSEKGEKNSEKGEKNSEKREKTWINVEAILENTEESYK